MTAQSQPKKWVEDKGLQRLHTLLWPLPWIFFVLVVVASLVAFALVAGPKALAHWPLASFIVPVILPILSFFGLYAVLIDPTGVFGRFLSQYAEGAGENEPHGRATSRKDLYTLYLGIPLLLFGANLFSAVSLAGLFIVAQAQGLGTACLFAGFNLVGFACMLFFARSLPLTFTIHLPDLSELRHRRGGHQPKHG